MLKKILLVAIFLLLATNGFGEITFKKCDYFLPCEEIKSNYYHFLINDSSQKDEYAKKFFVGGTETSISEFNSYTGAKSIKLVREEKFFLEFAWSLEEVDQSTYENYKDSYEKFGMVEKLYIKSPFVDNYGPIPAEIYFDPAEQWPRYRIFTNNPRPRGVVVNVKDSDSCDYNFELIDSSGDYVANGMSWSSRSPCSYTLTVYDDDYQISADLYIIFQNFEKVGDQFFLREYKYQVTEEVEIPEFTYVKVEVGGLNNKKILDAVDVFDVFNPDSKVDPEKIDLESVIYRLQVLVGMHTQ